MKIRVWGARGSLPTPIDPTEIEEKICQAIYGLSGVDTGDMAAVRAYVAGLPPLLRGTAGGNTACIEIQSRNETFIIDAGTGLRRLGLSLMKGPCKLGQATLHFFFSHPHWDHIQGFPFFAPAYIPGNRIFIYSIHDLETILAGQQRFANFPVPLSAMQADLEFVRLEAGQPLTIGRVTINTIRNNHPGDSFGYRFEDPHSIFVYASDAEYKALDEASLQKSLAFFQDADALVFDAQYGLRESWETKSDWGHSSAMIGIDLARQAGVKRLLLFHHEPNFSDEQLQAIQKTAADYQAQDPSLPACEVLTAYEGLELDLTPAGTVDLVMMAEHDAAVLTPSTIFDEKGVDQLSRQLAYLTGQERADARPPLNPPAAGRAYPTVGTQATQTGRTTPEKSILDLSQVERLTTASLKALVSLSRQYRSGPLVLAAPSPAVVQVINLAGYGDYFAIYATIEEAVKAVEARQALNLPGQMIAGQYQIVEKLGEGRLGTVLKVTDIQQKRVVALRLLSPTFGVETVDRLAIQLHLLLELDHPHLARIYDCDWSQDGHYTYIVEELLEGPPLSTWLAGRQAPLAVDEALAIALELVAALEYAHNRGVLHGNLKPQDIFMTGAGAATPNLPALSVGAVPSVGTQATQAGSIMLKIRGFGLGRLEEDRNLLEAPMLFLAASHLAPEQILGQPVDARTDLYALGVLLYQLFTGRLPFEGTEREMLEAHLARRPRSPRELNPQLSRAAEHLILKLLAKNPNDRYASAQQTRRIISGLIFGGDSISPRSGALRASAGLEGGLLGREEQLQLLQHYWAEAQAGRGQMAFLAGEAGIGKTSLVQQFAAQMNQSLSSEEAPPEVSPEASPEPVEGPVEGGERGQAAVLVGQCRVDAPAAAARTTQAQGGAYYPFSEALRAYFATVPPELFEPETRPLLGNLIALVPELQQLVPGLTAPPPLEPAHEQLRLISSLAQYIRRATRHRSWLLILEDLHWVDPGSLELLRYLGRHLPDLPLFIIGTYRSVQAGRDHRLQAALRDLSGLPGYHPLALDRLGQSEVTRLLQNLWTPAIPEALSQKIYRQTEGNPLYVREVVRSLEDNGLVGLRAGQWRFPEVETVRLPQSIYETVEERLHYLSPDTREVLSQAAVLGPAFRLADLVLMSRLPEEVVLEHLDLALERQLVQELSSNDTLHFSHSEIHYVIYNDLGMLRRRRLHRRAGEALEQRPPADLEALAEALAHHFTEANQLEKALVYSLQAARQARKSYAVETASRWYRQALEILDQLDPEARAAFQNLRLSLYKELGDVLTLTGRWVEAQEFYQQTLELAGALGDRAAEAWAQAARGKLSAQQGQLLEAAGWLEQAQATFVELGDQAGLGEVLHQKGTLKLNQGSHAEARTLYEESLAIRRSLGDKVNIANLLSNLGLVAQEQGDLSLACSFTEESLKIRRALEDKEGIAISLNNLGYFSNLSGDPSKARPFLEEAIAIQREVGDRMLLIQALNNLGNSFRDSGDYAAAGAQYRESLKLSRELAAAWSTTYLLADVAGLAALQAQPEQAAVLFGAAQTHRQTTGIAISALERAGYDRLLGLARQALGEAATKTALLRGQALSLEEAIDYALQLV